MHVPDVPRSSYLESSEITIVSSLLVCMHCKSNVLVLHPHSQHNEDDTKFIDLILSQTAPLT